MSVYTLPTHRAQHHYPAKAPSDCVWCAREDYRRTQEIAAWEAAREPHGLSGSMRHAMGDCPDDCYAPASLYAPTQRDATTGLGRLLLLLTALALIGAGLYIGWTTPALNGARLIAAPALTVLGAIAAYAALKGDDR